MEARQNLPWNCNSKDIMCPYLGQFGEALVLSFCGVGLILDSSTMEWI